MIKNAEALERLEAVDTLVVDKTGTLTLGKPKVMAIRTVEGFDENEALRLAASLERAANILWQPRSWNPRKKKGLRRLLSAISMHRRAKA